MGGHPPGGFFVQPAAELEGRGLVLPPVLVMAPERLVSKLLRGWDRQAGQRR